MSIRLCRPQDIARVAAFYDRVTDYLAGHINYPHWQHGLYPALPYVQAMAATDSMFLYEQEGAVVGAFVLNDNPQGEYDKGAWSRDLPLGRYLVIHALAADPDLARQGIAREMVRFCLSFARQQGYSAVRLDTTLDNLPAKRLYMGCGFGYVGDYDLGRNIPDIPAFSLFEYNFNGR